MTLISVEFALLWLASAILYFIFPLKYRWTVLLAASTVFYFWGGIGTGYFMLLTVAVVYLTARVLDKYNVEHKEYLKNNPDLTRDEKKALKLKNQKKKRVILSVGLVICFAFLVFLKYFNFLSQQTFGILGIFGVQAKAPEIDLALPLGISFYTLQATSYIVDVYRGKLRAEKNIAKVMLFVSFFPQIIQGPIGRFGHLAPQLYEGHRFNFTQFKYGLQLFLWGLIKKLTLAEYMGIIADEVFTNYNDYKGIIILIGSMVYGVQVYADFSGGMDMIRGVAQVFGIEMAVNFERPYFARSVAEFWRRWHITLGAWMKDYVFYPLSLSKAFASMGKKTRKVFGTYIGKMLPTFLASFVAFFLVGIWHGSSYKYVIYGLWNSVIISGSILLDPVYKKVLKKLKVNTECFSWQLFQIVRTFFLVSIGRIFSRADSLTASFAMLRNMFSEFNPWVLTDGTLYELGLTAREMFLVFLVIIVLFVVSLMQEKGMKIREALDKQNMLFQWLVVIGAIIFLMIYGAYGESFNAADFVYQQF
ncbi:MAG: MBOAT family protein [Clostridia bacterium]|nr:MBOAT family protein [Clostridia bacterium]